MDGVAHPHVVMLANQVAHTRCQLVSVTVRSRVRETDTQRPSMSGVGRTSPIVARASQPPPVF